jgi:hypothetical protein
LNLLFGTTFPVMVQNRARTQTTQGVWMALSQSQQGNKDNVLVFDVEGVDSRERGEHHMVYCIDLFDFSSFFYLLGLVLFCFVCFDFYLFVFALFCFVWM